MPVILFTLACTAADGPIGRSDEAGGFRVALLTAGPVSDAGWNAGAYEGLLMLQDSLGAEISHQQTRAPSEYDEAFLAYGSQGFDIVFAHGFEFQDAALRAAESFPQTTFVVSGGGRVARNLVPIVFGLNEGAYLAGIVAGALSVSGTVGMVGGVEIPPVQGTFRAFEAGARRSSPDIRILESFTGNWDDVAAAKEAAVAQLSQGADVVIHNVDAASFGVFQAVREARAAGREIWALGMNRDQNDVAPDVIVGSAVISAPGVFLRAAKMIHDREIESLPDGGSLADPPSLVFTAGIANGLIDFVANPALDVIPDAAEQAVREARRSIIAGELEVPAIRYVEGIGDVVEDGEDEEGSS